MRLVLFSSLMTCGSAFVSGPSCERKVSQSSLFMMDLPSAVPSDAAPLVISNIRTSSSLSNPNTNLSFNIANGIRDFLVPPANAAEAPKPPTNDEIKLLRSALGALYGERNPEKAEELITNAISAWERQAPDERAALYRVRADCFMGLADAEGAYKDYSTTVDLLTGPGGNLADPEELPAAVLGRARALRSTGGKLTPEQFKQAAQDYQLSLRLSSREDWDTNEENEQDGASRNPYAAWEWGMAQRGAGEYNKAAETHILASASFKDIGDRARSVISKLDAGIDLAATDDVEEARKILEAAIKTTTSVEGNDVQLLQRVIAKEGEARIALASILWNSNEKAAAESQLGEACSRFEQLQADADAREAARKKSGAAPPVQVKKLAFTVDDIVGAEVSCSRFKNDKFLSETLLWPQSLQDKAFKLTKLGK